MFCRSSLIRLAIPAAMPLLSGCGLPLPLVIAGYAADAVSLVETGKTVSDHALSAVIEEDCRVWRVMKGEEICLTEEEKADHVLADAGPVTVEPLPPPGIPSGFVVLADAGPAGFPRPLHKPWIGEAGGFANVPLPVPRAPVPM